MQVRTEPRIPLRPGGVTPSPRQLIINRGIEVIKSSPSLEHEDGGSWNGGDGVSA
jgi:hypothetical protein